MQHICTCISRIFYFFFFLFTWRSLCRQYEKAYFFVLFLRKCQCLLFLSQVIIYETCFWELAVLLLPAACVLLATNISNFFYRNQKSSMNSCVIYMKTRRSWISMISLNFFLQKISLLSLKRKQQTGMLWAHSVVTRLKIQLLEIGVIITICYVTLLLQWFEAICLQISDFLPNLPPKKSYLFIQIETFAYLSGLWSLSSMLIFLVLLKINQIGDKLNLIIIFLFKNVVFWLFVGSSCAETVTWIWKMPKFCP